jgi:FkbM family methyltransferase
VPDERAEATRPASPGPRRWRPNEVYLNRVRSTLKESLRTVSKAAANRLGYDVHELGSTGRSARLVLDSIKARGWLPSSVIDVGVAYGTHDLYQAFPSANYLLVEPVSEWLPQIRRLTRAMDVTIVEAAASDVDGELEVNVYRDPSATSPLEDVARSDEALEARTVRAARLDTLCRDWRPSDPLLIKIDVQGFEGRVLAGAEEVLGRTDALLVESSLHINHVGGSDLYSLVSWLGERGFRPFDVYDGCVKDGVLLQVDVAFARRGSELWDHLS